MNRPAENLDRSESGVSRLAHLAANHNLSVFFTIACAFSWLVDLSMIFFRAPIGFCIPLMSFGPTIAALITHRLATGNYWPFRVKTTWIRTLSTSVFGVALVLLAYVVIPGVATADPRKLNWGILTSVGVYNYSTFLGGPLGEEPGWRGYALPRLEARFGPVTAAMLLGILWTGWHLPLFLAPGWTSSPLWIFFLILLGLSFIMTVGVNLSRFSIVTAIAMHAAFNTISGFLNGLFADVQPRVKSIPFELVLALCGLAAALVIIIITKGRLAYSKDLNMP